MLFLQFQAGDNNFGIGVEDIVEVIPPVNLKSIAKAPAYVPGQFNYRGKLVPVIDISLLISGKRVRNLLSTRIILVKYELSDSRTETLGLMCEQVMDIVETENKTFETPGYLSEQTPYLGKVIYHKNKIFQLVKCGDLLNDDLRKRLFSENI